MARNVVTIGFMLAVLLRLADCHGLMVEPPQRGILRGNRFAPRVNRIEHAPRDPYAHFPAGDKSTRPGAGKHSQERAGKFNWTPFEPLEKNFLWRAGVCGDLKTRVQPHLRGGAYYFGGHITRTYRTGGTIGVRISVVAHHNGFVEMHLCDVKKCSDEISEACFKNGHCRMLNRARNRRCDSGYAKECGPIDRKYPGRWYLPCATKSGWEQFGGEHMTFSLPNEVTCDHCVLHWFWSAANTCNPPGVEEYFRGPDRPKNWGRCPGQGGAVGGYTRVQRPCGGTRFPEEYYQCADIRIIGRHKPRHATPRKRPHATSADAANDKSISDGTPAYAPLPTKTPSRHGANTNAPTYKQKKTGRSPFLYFDLVADGETVMRLKEYNVVNIKRFSRVAIEAVTNRRVSRMYFYIDGKKIWTDYHRPYFMFGNKRRVPNYWPNPIVDEQFHLLARADGYSLGCKVLFVK